MSSNFRAEGENQFLYSSLKSTFQQWPVDPQIKPETVTELETTIPDDAPKDKVEPQVPWPPPAPPAPPSANSSPLSTPPESPTPSPRPMPVRQPAPRLPPCEKSTCQANRATGAKGPPLPDVSKPVGQGIWTMDPGEELRAQAVADVIGEDEEESANLVSSEEPHTHKQAMMSPDASEWEAAEAYELDAIQRLGTYQLVPLLQSRTSKVRLFCLTQIMTPETVRNTSKTVNIMYSMIINRFARADLSKLTK